jgi:hypothetical protein
LLKNGALVIDARWTTFLAGSHRLVGANQICGDSRSLSVKVAAQPKREVRPEPVAATETRVVVLTLVDVTAGAPLLT